MMARMHELFPDLHVEVSDILAEEEKVVVCNLWTGSRPGTGEHMEFHGFVMWRIADGKMPSDGDRHADADDRG